MGWGDAPASLRGRGSGPRAGEGSQGGEEEGSPVGPGRWGSPHVTLPPSPSPPPAREDTQWRGGSRGPQEHLSLCGQGSGDRDPLGSEPRGEPPAGLRSGVALLCLFSPLQPHPPPCSGSAHSVCSLSLLVPKAKPKNVIFLKEEPATCGRQRVPRTRTPKPRPLSLTPVCPPLPLSDPPRRPRPKLSAPGQPALPRPAGLGPLARLRHALWPSRCSSNAAASRQPSCSPRRSSTAG